VNFDAIDIDLDNNHIGVGEAGRKKHRSLDKRHRITADEVNSSRVKWSSTADFLAPSASRDRAAGVPSECRPG